MVEAVSKTRQHKPTIRYPGVTTVMKYGEDMTHLEQWKSRVGHEEANRITFESTSIGNSLDSIVMASFRYDFDEDSYVDTPGYQMYMQLKPTLSNVVSAGTQIRLWSDKLKMKGFSDIIGWYDGVLSVMDVKNTKKTKLKQYLGGYFRQCTSYSMMLYDMTGLEAKQIVILMADRSSTVPQIFVERTKNYASDVVSRSRNYHLSILPEEHSAGV